MTAYIDDVRHSLREAADKLSGLQDLRDFLLSEMKRGNGYGLDTMCRLSTHCRHLERTLATEVYTAVATKMIITYNFGETYCASRYVAESFREFLTSKNVQPPSTTELEAWLSYACRDQELYMKSGKKDNLAGCSHLELIRTIVELRSSQNYEDTNQNRTRCALPDEQHLRTYMAEQVFTLNYSEPWHVAEKLNITLSELGMRKFKKYSIDEVATVTGIDANALTRLGDGIMNMCDLAILHRNTGYTLPCIVELGRSNYSDDAAAYDKGVAADTVNYPPKIRESNVLQFRAAIKKEKKR